MSDNDSFALTTLLGAGAIGAFLGANLRPSENGSVPVTPVPSSINHSFPDIWDALFYSASPSFDEIGKLLAYRYFYSNIADLLDVLSDPTHQYDREQTFMIIKERFDRYQCRLIGLKAGLNIQGYHSILDIGSGLSATKVCLIDHYQSVAEGSFLTAQSFGNVLLDEATLRCPRRNSLRQFYLIQMLNGFVNKDFIDLKESGNMNIDTKDPFFLRKLGGLMSSVYGRQRVINDPRGSAILQCFTVANIFSSLRGDTAYIHVGRKAEFNEYKPFINHLTDIIYG